MVGNIIYASDRVLNWNEAGIASQTARTQLQSLDLATGPRQGRPAQDASTTRGTEAFSQ
jgi:hypothetical protein